MRHRRSPNFGERRQGLRPTIVVIHYTAMQDAAAAEERLCDPEAEVSAHYLIDRSGQVTCLVDEEHRAWHAGVGEWRGLDDINSRSIGIELDNTGAQPFPEPQMVALEELLRRLMGRWQIAPENVIGHSDMAPGRKHDPGTRFDWQRLAAYGLAVETRRAGPQAPDSAAFRSALVQAGYTAPCSDADLLAAFRLRHRQGALGPLDEEDMARASGCAPASEN
ncbi:N-acetylmuramoyl-L-alanine amidase [uncultured Roseobacter sp.]|uniref:N-acetylmuramoyl-L-alanine amidase n=1 Tax=uncultured Roseobacter sp. TaxID=114847 RepID=UPI00260C9391|nr:N-acetylmuramoyl-L-alanine amidase [uncultured Roseobacter sp.]